MRYQVTIIHRHGDRNAEVTVLVLDDRRGHFSFVPMPVPTAAVTIRRKGGMIRTLEEILDVRYRNVQVPARNAQVPAATTVGWVDRA